MRTKRMNTIKKILSNPYTVLICRLVVGYVFISFGINKISDPSVFAKEVSNYGVAPGWSINLIAIILPWIELVVGMLFLFGIRLKTNALLSAALLLLFMSMVGYAWARGLDISCGCSATNPMRVGLPKILENAALTTLCAIVWFFPKKALTIMNLSPIEK